MGNVLSASVPSLIQPVESYIGDLSDFEFVQSLGSTRFMKVARGVSCEGCCLVKVFVHQDPSFSLDPYREQLERVSNALSNAPNCSPYQRIVITEKAAILLRQYGSVTLYDRLTTRPFMTDMEKRWVAFMLLKALQQCHEAQICHGDIKSQNIIMSSSGWLLLTDFASFKPALLPYDNPSDFTYFFDTSRRRTCNVAPERFLSANEVASSGASPQGPLVNSPEECCTASLLEHSMDIFSAGCVLTELFTDGQNPFDLSQLLTYRQQKMPDISRVMDFLPKNRPELSEMIAKMLDREPKNRPSAEDILDTCKGTLFPDIFYDFLWPYMQNITRQPLLPVDDILLRLRNDMDLIFERLQSPSEDLSNCSLIILTLVTSLIRSLNYCTSKLHALSILRRFARHSNDTVILERILPYVLSFWPDPEKVRLNLVQIDPFPRVRAEAIHTVTDILELVHKVPRDECRVFGEYVLPRISQAVRDDSSLVRMALASNVARLANTAKRFLDLSSVYLSQADPQVQSESGEAFDRAQLEATRQKMVRRELRHLQENVQELVVSLLCDRDNHVKQALVRSRLEMLCEFFGKQKASDVLLSHMITFLNDKQDWRLRASFYQFCVTPALYIGWQSTLLLKPLLQQGLRDYEELVTFQTMSCLASLCKNSLLQKHTIYEMLPDTIAFLAHPNYWLRVAAVSFLAALDKILNLADMHCKVMPLVNVYLKQTLIKLDKQSMLLRSLQEPLPRPLWDLLTRSTQMSDFFDFLRDKHTLRRLSAAQSALGALRGHVPETPALAQFYQKLNNQGLDDLNEEKLLAFREILAKMRRMRVSVSGEFSPTSGAPGLVDLSLFRINRKQSNLTENRPQQTHERIQRLQTDIDAAMNEEWQSMFGQAGNKIQGNAKADTKTTERSNGEIFAEEGKSNVLVESVDSESLSIEHAGGVDTSGAMDAQARMSSSQMQLVELINWKRSEWHRAARFAGKSSIATDRRRPSRSASDWRPEGRLLAHLHEHKAAVNRLALHPDGSLFGSCSADGTVKLWDCKRMQASSMANRSKLTYGGVGDRVRALSFLSDGVRVACAGDNCVLNVFNLETAAGAKNVRAASLLSLKTDPHTEGAIIDMSSWWDGCSELVVAVTHHGHLICWDLRVSKSEGAAWKFQNASEHGLVTAFCLDPRSQQWLCLGTTSGRMVLWDMRFQLAVNTGAPPGSPGNQEVKCSLTHPSERRVVRMWPARHDSNWHVWSSVAGNGEVALWNLENCSRVRAMWPCEHAPLSYQQTGSHSTTALVSCDTDTFLTGHSSGVLRLWNFGEPRQSRVVSSEEEHWTGPAGAAESKQRVYKTSMVDGVTVLTETKLESAKSRSSGRMASTRPLDLQVSTWHKDSISDMLLCGGGHQPLLVSSSRDGVIKVWK